MELLYKGFPELVDRLPPEIGDIPGPQPTLYIGTNIIDILNFEEETPKKSDAANGNSNEFGGLRVILVRDEETRDRLRSELGTSSLVLTILQSKGMEFDDVLLYDFLSTSPYSYKLNMLEELLKRRHHTDSHQKDNSGHGGGIEDGGESKYEWSSGPARGRNSSAYRMSQAEWTKDNIVSNCPYYNNIC
ncbi:hypothetical protein L873DRAFT_637474 [Choiromyces venosus 120613-1]|uniref:Uncharacterized protein n=1 Tax=Choiromyces venosus 120613-1 TaxID=1336337 RepID=A0A3N4JTV8_9PEZI|nr:hypothetical protein L873DRAFT_637474 [Choiromyces venosus 120613-1]